MRNTAKSLYKQQVASRQPVVHRHNAYSADDLAAIGSNVQRRVSIAAASSNVHQESTAVSAGPIDLTANAAIAAEEHTPRNAQTSRAKLPSFRQHGDVDKLRAKFGHKSQQQLDRLDANVWQEIGNSLQVCTCINSSAVHCQL